MLRQDPREFDRLLGRDRSWGRTVLAVSQHVLPDRHPMILLQIWRYGGRLSSTVSSTASILKMNGPSHCLHLTATHCDGATWKETFLET